MRVESGSRHVRSSPRADRWTAVLALGAVVVWVAFAVLFGQMYGSQEPHGAGFDFEILLSGARRVAAGGPPYEPFMLAGGATGIAEQFYTYPPPVAQLLAPLSGLSSLVVTGSFLVAAALAGAAVLASILSRAAAPRRWTLWFFLSLAVLPFWFPFTLAMLFANLDALFVALYGLVVLAAVERVPSRRSTAAAGIALAVAIVAKLHPAVLGVWMLARGWREWRRGEPGVVWACGTVPRSWSVAAAAAAAGVALLLLSLLAGGMEPWRDYVSMLRSSTGVDLLDPRNLGPVPQLVLWLGLGASAVGPTQSVMVVAALASTIAAALIVDDPLTSILWAITASLVVLPVTWFHHFAVLAPVLAAAVARSWVVGSAALRRTMVAVLASVLIGIAGFGTVVAWMLVPAALATVRLSSGTGQATDAVAGARSLT